MVVDFSYVPEKQLEMHDRLINWGLCSRNITGQNVAAGFDGYQSPSTVDRYGELTKAALDHRDAHRIGKAVSFLPTPHRLALSWYYIAPGSPTKACKAIACTVVHLSTLVIDGRNMLINRKA